jgi:hypothetical protein
MKSYEVTPTSSGGFTIHIDGAPAISVEPIGTPTEAPIGSKESGQHYIATALVGPDKGRQMQIPPSRVRSPDPWTEGHRRIRYA